MEVKKDELVAQSKSVFYDDFDRQQYIVKLDAGESVEITVKDSGGSVLGTPRVFAAKYINCHFNLQWQDKGVMK